MYIRLFNGDAISQPSMYAHSSSVTGRQQSSANLISMVPLRITQRKLNEKGRSPQQAANFRTGKQLARWCRLKVLPNSYIKNPNLGDSTF
jgi:hypothetical protein